ncbi:MAG: ParB/RepB/Spo0J family partition protein [Janthinobacterium lividum]
MSRRPRAPSPILGAVAATIEAESRALVTNSGFRHTFEVPVDTVEPDPGQPRRAFDDDGLRQLAATMDERGQLQPILLRRHPEERNRWMIVAGERRWRAAAILGWKTMLAIEHDGDPEVASLLENLQRVDLTVVEEARGVRRLMESKGWTQSQAAEAVGRSKGEMSAVLRVLHLPQELLDQVLTSEPPVPRNTLIELARIKEPEEQRRLVAAMRDGGMTIRELRQAKATAERPDNPSPVRFSTTVLDRLAQRLGELRAAGQVLDQQDRQRLERLRTEIDALLSWVG